MALLSCSTAASLAASVGLAAAAKLTPAPGCVVCFLTFLSQYSFTADAGASIVSVVYAVTFS